MNEEGNQAAEPEPEPAVISDQERTTVRSLYRHPLAAAGGALIVAGALGFVILSLLDLTADSNNPYRSLVTWVAFPAVVLVGALLFLLAIRFQVVAARRRGEHIRLRLRIEPSDKVFMRNLWLFAGLSAIFALVVAFTGYKGYEATDSVSFCGSTCHEVMGPEEATYAKSPHARVPCVECHIGPGGSFWVRSKIDGIRQLFATVLNTYEQPIETPVHSLRPAQQTCEECHWPAQFYGEKLVTHQYYDSDEANSPWTISLLVKIGGSNPRTGKLEGVHWHMLGEHRIEYVASDAKRNDIDWVRVTDGDGNVTLFTDPTLDSPIDPADTSLEVRSFDCVDCHNRPSHTFVPPATSISLALSTGRISTDIPYIRRTALDLLNDDYPDTDTAHQQIRDHLMDFYRSEYANRFTELQSDLEQTAAEIIGIYDDNFFPEMKTDYRAHSNHVGHFLAPGCFRCHDGHLVSDTGQVLARDCNACHLIVAQGPTSEINALDTDLSGLEFHHPADVGDLWKQLNCSDCHGAGHNVPDISCITCHPQQAGQS